MNQAIYEHLHFSLRKNLSMLVNLVNKLNSNIIICSCTRRLELIIYLYVYLSKKNEYLSKNIFI